MERKNRASSRPKSPRHPKVRPLTDRDRRIAANNAARLVEALDSGGEEALQKELDRLYPGTKASPPPKR
jgi:hypothetical protein